jgi:hypothetical protein
MERKAGLAGSCKACDESADNGWTFGDFLRDFGDLLVADFIE